MLSRIAFGQGAYYALTALWPFVDMHSFLLVTGSKTDLWLVRTVGALILVISLPLLSSAFRKTTSNDVILLGVSACVALASVDIYYVARRVIASIYLGDALIELILLGVWLWALVGRK
jgi:hypothetical protein